jgi:branched-chain amino acid transport system substrate-binding protein
MQRLSRFILLALGAGVLLFASSYPAPRAFADDTIKIAVMNDQSKVYADLDGQGGVSAVRMAVQDEGGAVLGKSIKVLSVDHQNDPALASTKAHELFESQGASAIIGLPTSSVSLAVSAVGAADHKIVIVVGGATDDLTMTKCNKYTFHYGYDTYALAQNTGKIVTENGGKRWYMLTADYAFGQSMLRNFAAAIGQAGGSVIHNDFVPLGNTDFSTYLLQAQAMKPDVIGLMNAGGDTINSMKQINEFGLQKRGIKVGVGLLFDSDVASLGPDYWNGATITIGSYWNLDDKTRAFADRFKAKTGKRPTWIQIADYSAAYQYIEAVRRANSIDADAVAKALEGYHFEDLFARHAYIRAQDHLLIHDMYVADVKPASAVTTPYDFFKIVKTVPGEQAYRPLSQVTCKM